MAKDLITQIEEAISVENKKTISAHYAGKSFKIDVNENINIYDVDGAIDMIIHNVVEQDFKYSLIDVLESYFILKLFTNIEPPMVDENIADYEKCHEIVVKLQLKEILCEESYIIADYISMIEQNVWRGLEYEKSLTALTPYESLLDALANFYEILDAMEKFAEANQDIDVEKLTKQIEDISSQISLIDEMKKAENNV